MTKVTACIASSQVNFVFVLKTPEHRNEAEYLHRLSEITRDTIATEKFGKPFAQLSTDQQSVAAARTISQLKENRYDPASRTLRLSPGEVAAYHTELGEWSDYFTRKDTAPGLPANYIHDPTELKSLTSYFAWAVWAAAAADLDRSAFLAVSDVPGAPAHLQKP